MLSSTERKYDVASIEGKSSIVIHGGKSNVVIHGMNAPYSLTEEKPNDTGSQENGSRFTYLTRTLLGLQQCLSHTRHNRRDSDTPIVLSPSFLSELALVDLPVVDSKLPSFLNNDD